MESPVAETFSMKKSTATSPREITAVSKIVCNNMAAFFDNLPKDSNTFGSVSATTPIGYVKIPTIQKNNTMLPTD